VHLYCDLSVSPDHNPCSSIPCSLHIPMVHPCLCVSPLILFSMWDRQRIAYNYYSCRQAIRLHHHSHTLLHLGTDFNVINTTCPAQGPDKFQKCGVEFWLKLQAYRNGKATAACSSNVTVAKDVVATMAIQEHEVYVFVSLCQTCLLKLLNIRSKPCLSAQVCTSSPL
jgi:hypothetical protein